MLSLKQAMLAIVIGAVAGNILLGLAAMIGADARVPGMVLLRAPLGRRGSYAPTVLNVRAEPRLVDLRADHHLDGGRGALRARLRLRGPLALGARVRRRVARARAARPDRVRPALPEEVRRLGGCRLDRLPDLVGARQGEPARALGHRRNRRGLDRPGRRPRDREHRLLDAARGRLHTLRPRPPQRLLRRRGRLPAADALVLRARVAAGALARPERAVADPDRGRERQRACRRRAADADRRRERRGVRGHLLDRGLAPELHARASRSGC